MDRKTLEAYIAETYGAEPEYLWEKYPTYAVFRHSDNRKWFAAVMTIPKTKLGIQQDGMIDIVDVKCDPILIGSLRSEPGFFQAYHMSKESWLTVSLDGSVAEDKIKMLVEMSFQATAAKIKKWSRSAED